MLRSQADYEKEVFGSLGGKLISKNEITAILKFLSPKNSERILDIGIGTGRIARQIIKTCNANVVGIDINKENIRQANVKKRKNPFINKDEYSLIIADGRFLPFRNSCFDSMICIRALKYFPDYQAGISEMSRVLKNHGKVVLTLSNVFSVDFFLLRFGVLAYRTLFNFRKVIQIFKKNKLLLVDYVGLHKIHPKVWTIFNKRSFMHFLSTAESFLQKFTPKELFAREILVKLVKNQT